MKKKISIKINPAHKGDFTAFAKKHGKTAQQMAKIVMSNTDNYSPHVVKMANFAKNFSGKKAQTGIDNTAVFNPGESDQPYNWLNTEELVVPGIPTQTNSISKIRKMQGTGVYEQNPYVTGFNELATGVTGIANLINNNKLKKREEAQVLESLQPAYFENKEGNGLNNLPMYTKYGGGKKQTGGGSGPRRLAPEEMQQWNQFLDFVKQKGYEGSADLNAKNKNLGSSLFTEFKASNPGININYDIVPSVQNEMQMLQGTTRDFLKRKSLPGADNALQGISPVDGWFGSKTSQFRFPAATLNTYNNGSLIENQDLGLVNSNLQATGARSNSSGRVSIKKQAPAGVKLETFYDASGNANGQGYTDPTTGDLIRLQAGGTRLPGNGMPSGLVEAEEGEIVEGGDGNISKIDDNAGTHEQGGVKVDNVSRVLEDTSDKRKDKASKALLVTPEEMEALFGFKPNRSVSHSKALELANEHYNQKRDKINKSNDIINKKSKIDKYAAKSAKLNFNTLQDIPSKEDVFDALYMHQEHVKKLNNIKDDGSMTKTGGKINWKYQAGGGRGAARQRAMEQALLQAAPESSFIDIPENPNTGIVPYKGGKTTQGSTTPMGNSNAFNFPGGLDTFKQAWSPILNLNQYNSIDQAQKATYDYLVKNQPDVAASIWENQGLTQKGRDLMNPKAKDYDPAFARVANELFDQNGKLKPGVKLTSQQLEAISPAYVDNMLGIRAVTPSQFTNTTTEQTNTPGIQRSPLNPSVNINPKFITQPDNKFHEKTYWDELAPSLLSLTDSLNRTPELYNPVEIHQLQYKLMDPTAALNANQADYNTATDQLGNMNIGSGANAANLANLQAQKYAVNNQVNAQYDNQNTQIKNNEITYNTQVRDRQSVADAQTRGNYSKDVQLSREAQRQQRLKSIEDISRVIQMKRRQNRSGNLILKLSPAFDQNGEYNGYQYQPVLPPELGLESQLPVIGGKKSNTKTTTTWKMGDRTVKTETKQ